ncbi:MAG TPA: NADH-ubiquinone oxidoreductase-F iron-sulfur binding region domain-containing protein [Steroidobacteraceae bacterium]|nr:NADH-ubiquinone oxidoreductase-F iron-sulfur binding region domain-containing protein [Steroidobacteraceae bacterium]
MTELPMDLSGVADCVDAAVAYWGSDSTRLLQVLREVQERYNHVPPAALEHAARRLQLPISRVRGVAAFYDFLSTEPLGRYHVLFSDDVVDRMHGSAALLERMCHRLWVEPGKPSEDGLVCVERASFLGFCDQPPSLLVNQRPITRLDEARIDLICECILARRPLAEWPAELFVVEETVCRAGPLLSEMLVPGAAIRAALERSPDPSAATQVVLEEIKRANLLGRGGAGYTTGLKWESCRRQSVTPRVVVCNADEGEPGTFKDRLLLTRHADLVFEGMTVAALGIEAKLGFLYLRGEYRYLLEGLREVLDRRRACGLLGQSICGRDGFDFDIEIHVGAGSYVCGEASALVESLEGNRGIPRNRPPRLAEKGYLGLPTIVNNVETYCAAAQILEHGADRFRALGTAKSSGTKLLSVSGDCARPGVYEYPFGVTIREVLADCGAGRTIAVQCGGPSGRCLDQDEFDRRVAFEDIETGGALIVFDDGRDMFEVARHFSHFFADESCGFCTPCRVGTSLLARLMDKISDGRGSEHDLQTIEQLARLLHGASHCGLGESAGKPLADTLQRFRPTYVRRLVAHGVEPAFDLDGALARARRVTGRDDPGAHLLGESA